MVVGIAVVGTVLVVVAAAAAAAADLKLREITGFGIVRCASWEYR